MNGASRWAWLGGIPCALCFVLFIVALAWVPFGWPRVMFAGSGVTGMNVWTASPWAWPALLTFTACILIQLLLAIWVGVDANRKGMNGFLWGTLVFFTCVVGLVVYLIVSRPGTMGAPMVPPGRGAPVAAPPAAACGSCGASLQPDFRACPYCGHPIGADCPTCRRSVKADWKACPYCATSLDAGGGGA